MPIWLATASIQDLARSEEKCGGEHIICFPPPFLSFFLYLIEQAKERVIIRSAIPSFTKPRLTASLD